MELLAAEAFSVEHEAYRLRLPKPFSHFNHNFSLPRVPCGELVDPRDEDVPSFQRGR